MTQQRKEDWYISLSYHFLIFFKLLKKFMKAGSRIILRLRAEKALENMKTLLGGANNREDVRKLVLESW